MYKKLRYLAPALMLLLIGWSNQALSAPITFNTALPVAKGEFILREQLIVNQSGDDPSGLNRDRQAVGLVTALGYGVSGKLAVFGVLPYRDNELKMSTGGQRRKRPSRPFGETSALSFWPMGRPRHSRCATSPTAILTTPMPRLSTWDRALPMTM